jgi:tetratricopeptide (TPR) repeat protein
VTELSLPPSLRLTILRRLSLLPEGTLEALRAASILGSSFALTDLSSVAGRSVADLSAVLAEAIRARIVEDDGDRLRFRHDLIREAIYQDLPTGMRVGLHREAGRRLAASGAAALRVAEHLARGAGTGDAEAIAWLTRAAREAASRSPAVAADLLERAVGLADPADPGRDRLLAERAGALMWSGRLPDAEAICRSLLDRDHDPSVEASARLLLARTLAAQGRVRDSLRELERVQRSQGLSDELRAGASGAEAMARIELGDLDGAMAAARQARTAAAAAGDHTTIALAMASVAGVEQLRGTCARGSSSSTRRCDSPTSVPSGGDTSTRSMWYGGASSSSWTGSRTPGAPSRPAGGPARSSASAGPSPSIRPTSGWSGSWPASGTTPSPSSRRPRSWPRRPASATALSSATASGR